MKKLENLFAAIKALFTSANPMDFIKKFVAFIDAVDAAI